MGATTTKIGICNRALQLLGNSPIASLTEGSKGAKSLSVAYDSVFLSELQSNTWNFSINRANLAADVTPPIFGKPRSFPLPGDFLFLAPEETTFIDPKRRDFQIEGASILSSEQAPLPIRYVSSNITESSFDAIFAEAFACALALAICEDITDSTTKLQSISARYDYQIKMARKRNAIQNAPVKSPTCSWITVRD